VLQEARAEIGGRRFAPESVDDISSETRRLLDQLAYRFGKLQDTLGLRVLPGLLDLSEEPLPESTPFGEKLQRLERLGVIPSVNQWRILRELRNQLAHEYLDAPALKAAALNRFIDGVDSLLGLWRQVSSYAQRKGWSEAKNTGPHPAA
jgi:hypothetical protein